MGTRTRAIGDKNGLLWHVPDDLKRFKRLTLGHPVIMGRKTFESILAILGTPLPGRTNIILTRDPDYVPKGAVVAHDFDEALEIAQRENPTEIHIGGGAEVYTMALPYTEKIYATYYDDDTEGDTHFPHFIDQFTEVARHGERKHNDLTYEWVDYERTKTG